MNSGPYIKKKTTTSDILNNDEDREKLYQKIVELLIAAGYFRARISSLEPFDKVKFCYTDPWWDSMDFNRKLL
jgi:hypothetical protein